MIKKYSKPPIIEAVCEFKFVQKTEWDWTIPGIFYSKIRDKYPIKREIRGIGFGVKIDNKKKAMGSEISSNVVQKVEGMQFLDLQDKYLIQIRENILSVHKKKPYTTWEEFKPKILDVLNIYTKITENFGISRIGLRYINQFEGLPNTFRIEDYFNYYPAFPDNDQPTLGEIIVKSTLPMPNKNNLEGLMNILLYLNKIKDNDSEIKQILDLDMFFLQKEKDLIKIEDTEQYLEKGHKYIIETFESCITNKIREIIE